MTFSEKYTDYNDVRRRELMGIMKIMGIPAQWLKPGKPGTTDGDIKIQRRGDAPCIWSRLKARSELVTVQYKSTSGEDDHYLRMVQVLGEPDRADNSYFSWDKPVTAIWINAIKGLVP